MTRMLLTLAVSLGVSVAPDPEPLAEDRSLGVEPSRPNVLLIVADDLGSGDLGCFGSREIPTPHIDGIAERGVLCTQAYASSFVCAPSRAGLLTGRYGNRFGFENNIVVPDHVPPGRCGLPREEPTLGERLQRAGYATALFGKWHLGEHAEHHPNARGFGHFFGFVGAHHWHFPVGKKHFALQRNGVALENDDPTYLTDRLTGELLRWIDEGPEASPWFAYVSYSAPHTPLSAPAEDIARFSAIEDESRRTYCAMVSAIDRSVGRIVARLRELGELESTLIVVTSDHGGATSAGASNGALRGQKGTAFEGGVRVPLLLSWPEGWKMRGSRFEAPVSLLDLVPTVVAAVGSDLPVRHARLGHHRVVVPLDGVDLAPFFTGMREGVPHERLFWRVLGRAAAVRSGDEKLIRLPFRAPLLYDVRVDPTETHDLAASRPDRVQALLRTLHQWECEHERNPMWRTHPFYGERSRERHEEALAETGER